MKPSPLQLNWVSYLAASFELRDPKDTDAKSPLAVSVDPEVRFNAAGEHIVVMKVRSSDQNRSAYEVSVEAMAEFDFDLEIARREYKPRIAPALSTIIAVNIARIVYASAREYLAMLTSRAPFGSAQIESVLLEPSDVRISSDVPQRQLLVSLFGATEDEVEAYMGLQNESPAATVSARRGSKASSKTKSLT